MKAIMRLFCLAVFGVILAIVTGNSCLAATPGPAVTYTLIEGSQIIEECLMCGRPTVPVPLRGSFQLIKAEENPLFARYAVTNLHFTASHPGGGIYELRGGGTYELGGEVALRQSMSLAVMLNDGQTNQWSYFTQRDTGVSRNWPMLQVALEQTNGTLVQTFYLNLAAAPFRDLWFSTRQGLTPAAQPWETNRISSGDLLSQSGRVIRRNQQLAGGNDGPDLGLDAVALLPEGTFAFSTEENGTVWAHGDVVGTGGSWMVRNETVLASLGVIPPDDLGLDALQVQTNGGAMDRATFYYSITTDLMGDKPLRKGDLLRSDLATGSGQVFKRNADLLARFQPDPGLMDYGLDACHIWPHGEIWFSTEVGFQDRNLGPIMAGDLLSDQGYVVFRNLDLVNPFGPLEDLADFGLDALVVITDLDRPLTSMPTTTVSPDLLQKHVRLQWQGGGLFYQVEAATHVLGPFQPISPVIGETEFTDRGVLINQVTRFYWVRQW